MISQPATAKDGDGDDKTVGGATSLKLMRGRHGHGDRTIDRDLRGQRRLTATRFDFIECWDNDEQACTWRSKLHGLRSDTDGARRALKATEPSGALVEARDSELRSCSCAVMSAGEMRCCTRNSATRRICSEGRCYAQ